MGDAVRHLVSHLLQDVEDALSAQDRYIEALKASVVLKWHKTLRVLSEQLAPTW